MYSICVRCEKQFKHSPADARPYCNRDCYYPPIYRNCAICGTIKRFFPSAVKKTKSGNLFCSKKCLYIYRKMTAPKGENSPVYKGDEAKYSARHMWIKANFEMKDYCDHCGKNDKLEWANVSGEYKRDREDWLNLCRSCHRKFDLKKERKNLSLYFKSKHEKL